MCSVSGKIAHDRHVVSHVVVRDLFAAADAERGSDWLAKLKYKLAGRECRSSQNDDPAVSRRAVSRSRSFGNKTSRPANVAFLTTATLSLGSTMIAYSLIAAALGISMVAITTVSGIDQFRFER